MCVDYGGNDLGQLGPVLICFSVKRDDLGEAGRQLERQCVVVVTHELEHLLQRWIQDAVHARK